MKKTRRLKNIASVGKHRVLVFGEKVFGRDKPTLDVDYCDVDLISFPGGYEQLGRLADYDLVILDYSAFSQGNSVATADVFEGQQNVFDKLMQDALERGTCFCMLHYDEHVPSVLNDQGYPSVIDQNDVNFCLHSQIGYRWLDRYHVRPQCTSVPVNVAEVKRTEFEYYHQRWGSSKHYFRPYGDGHFNDVIFALSDVVASAFALSVRNGKIVYIPCQRDFARPQAVRECLEALIKATITYLTRSSSEIPSWAVLPIFPREEGLFAELQKLESKVGEVRKCAAPYQLAKGLVFQSEYAFQEALPKFLTDQLGLPTFRHEQYREDFWIRNGQAENIVIGETKTSVHGLRKSDIYALYNHREANRLDEMFPALLVANVHRNANSWEEKIRRIDKQDYEVAAGHNILIARIEDILLLWNGTIEKKIDTENMLRIILHEKGWMEVKTDGTIDVHK